MRPLTLAIISYPSHMETMFERMALHYAKAQGPEFAVERCQDPEDVVYLARLWKDRGKSIVRLDLHGHGDGGRFKMGDGMLFASDGTGYGLAKQLGPKLASNAEVRLLGCNTANEPAFTNLSGKKLLRDLQRILGRERRVLGTTDYLGPRDLGPRGLSDSSENKLKGIRP
jgi:hypothetical protein